MLIAAAADDDNGDSKGGWDGDWLTVVIMLSRLMLFVVTLFPLVNKETILLRIVTACDDVDGGRLWTTAPPVRLPLLLAAAAAAAAAVVLLLDLVLLLLV
jgi:hypothetical protein